GQLHRWYLAGMFLSTFLPTTIGGDGYRIYKTLDNPRAKSCAALPVIVERATGLSALLVLGFFAAVYIVLRDGDPLAYAIMVGGTICILAGAGFLLIAFRAQLLARLSRLRYVPKSIVTLVSFLEDFRQHPRTLMWALAISFLFHMNRIFGTWLLIFAMGIVVDPSYLAVAVMAGDVLGLLPISLGGFGLVDVSFIYIMGHFGLNLETGLTAMLLSRGLMIPISFLGGYYYYFRGGDRSTKNATVSEVVEK
ncbi:MAG: lysylphosphatidylglycerol synthase transmembrane domain-containing protein, partial [Gammaproteobacteria bacterium]